MATLCLANIVLGQAPKPADPGPRPDARMSGFEIPAEGGALKHKKTGKIREIYIPVSVLNPMIKDIKGRAGSLKWSFPTLPDADWDAVASGIGVATAGISGVAASTVVAAPAAPIIFVVGEGIASAIVIYDNVSNALDVTDDNINAIIEGWNGKNAKKIVECASNNSNRYVVIPIQNSLASVTCKRDNIVTDMNGIDYEMKSLNNLTSSDLSDIDKVLAKYKFSSSSVKKNNAGNQSGRSNNTASNNQQQTVKQVGNPQPINADRWTAHATPIYSRWNPLTKQGTILPAGTRIKVTEKINLSNGKSYAYFYPYQPGLPSGFVDADCLRTSAPSGSSNSGGNTTTQSVSITQKQQINADRWTTHTIPVYSHWNPLTQQGSLPAGTRIKVTEKITLSNGKSYVWFDPYTNGVKSGFVEADFLTTSAPNNNSGGGGTIAQSVSITQKQQINADRWTYQSASVYSNWQTMSNIGTLPTGTRIKVTEKITLSNGKSYVWYDNYTNSGPRSGFVDADFLTSTPQNDTNSGGGTAWSPSRQQQSQTYNTSNFQTIGNAVLRNYAGSNFLGDINATNGFRFTVNSNSSQTVKVIVKYKSDNRGGKLKINGMTQNISFSSTNWNWGTKEVQIQLQQGANTIEFFGGYQTEYAPDIAEITIIW